jgi:hypothetical protein
VSIAKNTGRLSGIVFDSLPLLIYFPGFLIFPTAKNDLASLGNPGILAFTA